MGKIVFLLFVVGVVFFAVQSMQQTVTIQGNTLVVEIMDTLAQRIQGLSGSASLDADKGMLFVYEKPGNYAFWMKDMNFAIDIIWINENKKIIGVQENISPETFPEKFYPPEPAQYILEVNAGWAQSHAIAVGDEVTF